MLQHLYGQLIRGLARLWAGRQERVGRGDVILGVAALRGHGRVQGQEADGHAEQADRAADALSPDRDLGEGGGGGGEVRL